MLEVEKACRMGDEYRLLTFRVAALRLCRWLAILAAACTLLLAPSALGASGVFVRARLEGVINPIQARHVVHALEVAEAQHAEFLLLSIDTPGGLVTSMQEITIALTNSRLPIIGFVEPRSGQATSAGAFILMATDIAAMAPGTRVGAAHPVAGGEPLKGALDEKATNSLASLMKSLAERRQRPTEPAVAMVRESASYTSQEALSKHLIELVVADEAALLKALDERKLASGKRLATDGLVRHDVDLSLGDRLLDKIADPTIVSILISLGMLALLYELTTAGIGAGGVVGALLLVLGLLGSSVLPLEMSALALFVIGFIALALEAKLPTHGVLAGTGIIALLLGALLLVDPSQYFGATQSVNLVVFAPLIVATIIGFGFVARAVRRTLHAPPTTGNEALIGKRGTARAEFGVEATEPVGQVFVDGARWSAETDEPRIGPGDPIQVFAVKTQPTRLFVRRV